jgi:hypothetical protein
MWVPKLRDLAARRDAEVATEFLRILDYRGSLSAI